MAPNASNRTASVGAKYKLMCESSQVVNGDCAWNSLLMITADPYNPCVSADLSLYVEPWSSIPHISEGSRSIETAINAEASSRMLSDVRLSFTGKLDSFTRGQAAIANGCRLHIFYQITITT